MLEARVYVSKEVGSSLRKLPPMFAWLQACRKTRVPSTVGSCIFSFRLLCPSFRTSFCSLPHAALEFVLRSSSSPVTSELSHLSYLLLWCYHKRGGYMAFSRATKQLSHYIRMQYAARGHNVIFPLTQNSCLRKPFAPQRISEPRVSSTPGASAIQTSCLHMF
jgi:hypothetical protein